MWVGALSERWWQDLAAAAAAVDMPAAGSDSDLDDGDEDNDDDSGCDYLEPDSNSDSDSETGSGAGSAPTEGGTGSGGAGSSVIPIDSKSFPSTITQGCIFRRGRRRVGASRSVHPSRSSRRGGRGVHPRGVFRLLRCAFRRSTSRGHSCGRCVVHQFCAVHLCCVLLCCASVLCICVVCCVVHLCCVLSAPVLRRWCAGAHE